MNQMVKDKYNNNNNNSSNSLVFCQWPQTKMLPRPIKMDQSSGQVAQLSIQGPQVQFSAVALKNRVVRDRSKNILVE